MTDIDFEGLFTDEFLAEVEKRKEKTDIDPATWRAGGRASKAWPNKEDSSWWLTSGPKMVAEWYDWWTKAKAEGWTLWTTPTGVPAVELAVNAVLGGKMFKGYIDALMVDPEGDLVVIDWKGLATFTPIPTPTGWKTMGELEVGDQVFGRDGKPCNITGKSKVKEIPCYRVRFDDGTSIVCDHEHLWHTVAGYGSNLKPGVRGVEEIRDTLRNPVTGTRQHRIPNAAPLTLPEAALPIPPYVLGVWIADGKSAGGSYTKPDREIADLIRAEGYEVREWNTKSRCSDWNIIGLAAQLREADLLGHKHVPDAYLRASVEQRTSLLRGLMDGDGTWNKKRSQAEFFNTDKAIAEAVYELAASLGERPYINAVSKKGFGLVVTCYEVKWRPHHFNPFALPRKAELVKFGKPGQKGSRRLIVAVESVPVVPTQCIAVDSDDNTYLCGEQMVPTHNTGREPIAPMQIGAYACAIEKTIGVRPSHGAHYMARKGDLGHVYDLSVYTEQLVGQWLRRAALIESQQLFIPHPSSLCGACGVRDWCSVMSEDLEKVASLPNF